MAGFRPVDVTARVIAGAKPVVNPRNSVCPAINAAIQKTAAATKMKSDGGMVKSKWEWLNGLTEDQRDEEPFGKP